LKKSSFLNEFKTFILRGNVLDMAVGVIIGGAFGKISSSLVNDLLMPFISWVCGSRDMNVLNLTVRPEELNEAGEIVREAIVLSFDTFLGTVIDFLLIAFVVFLLIRFINRAHALLEKKKIEEQEEKKTEEVAKPSTEELLEKILEELKNK